MTTKFFRKKIAHTIPHEPGIYKYRDEQGTLLYVGKAKDLYNRVTSYFNLANQTRKTQLMISKATQIEFTVVENERDALLLENVLIKEHQPPYNVSLKDDKTYPWICIKNERFPRVFMTRTFIKDGSQYFGPYTSVLRARTILDFVKTVYQLRTCSLWLSEKNIDAKKFRVCLEYHIGNCKGPCENHQSEEDYMQSILQIRSILKGNISPVVNSLKEKMNDFATHMKFEDAGKIKQKLNALEDYRVKTTIVNPMIHDVDVFSFLTDEKKMFVSFLKVMNGSIIQTQTIELKKNMEEDDDELLLFAIHELRTRFESTSKEIVLEKKIIYPDEKVSVTVPQKGDKKKLLELAHTNAVFFRSSRRLTEIGLKEKNPATRILEKLKDDFRLTEIPIHIECFDNSNFQGAYPVSSLVVFKNAKPSKKDYRHFNIKTVEGPDDFASMEEVVYRRYKRMIEENQPLPQLIMIDGGKGQLSSALKSLEKLNLVGQVAIAGIAKKLEEIYFPGDKLPLYVNKKSESLRLIQRIRDEAHRFGITHHRSRRDKGTLKTSLSDIKGIGKETADKLLKHFRSVAKIRSATNEEINKVIGIAKTKLLAEYFSENKKG